MNPESARRLRGRDLGDPAEPLRHRLEHRRGHDIDRPVGPLGRLDKHDHVVVLMRSGRSPQSGDADSTVLVRRREEHAFGRVQTLREVAPRGGARVGVRDDEGGISRIGPVLESAACKDDRHDETSSTEWRSEPIDGSCG